MTQTAPADERDEQRLHEPSTEPRPGVEAEDSVPARLAEAGARLADPGIADPGIADAVTKDTRERILDVAMDLFTEQGFDGTSLREIAERLGVTKAALYYHFESKDDILLALHMRLHEFGREALARIEDEPITLELWGRLLGELVDQMLAQRQLFLMHQRNQAALEKLHREEHDAAHEDVQNRFRRVLADPRVPLRDRVRMAASAGAVFSGFFLSGDSFAGSDDEELGQLLREVLHDVVGG